MTYIPGKQSIAVTVNGKPVAQPRPRFAPGGRVYTPKTADAWKTLVALAIKQEDWEPTEWPVMVSMVFYMPRPKKMRKSTQGRSVPHQVKPDIDNLVKAVLDAITDSGAIWQDDSQVADLHARKIYCPEAGYPAGVCLYIREIGDF